MATPKIQQMTCSRVKFKHYVYELEKKKNRIKSSVRAKVEHPLRILKPVFGFDRQDTGAGASRRTITGCARTSFAVNLYMYRKCLAVLG